MKNYTVPVTTHATATILEQDAIALAISVIDKKCNLQGGTHIDPQGNLCIQKEIRAGGHSSWETHIIRPATATDKAAALIIYMLQ